MHPFRRPAGRQTLILLPFTRAGASPLGVSALFLSAREVARIRSGGAGNSRVEASLPPLGVGVAHGRVACPSHSEGLSSRDGSSAAAMAVRAVPDQPGPQGPDRRSRPRPPASRGGAASVHVSRRAACEVFRAGLSGGHRTIGGRGTDLPPIYVPAAMRVRSSLASSACRAGRPRTRRPCSWR